jgi:outer membrane protein assembly factor BamB/plastocyanin
VVALRRLLPLVLILALVLGAAAPASAKSPRGCAPSGVPGGEWRSYGRDSSNTRNQPDEKLITAQDAPLLSPAWTFSTEKGGGAGDITGTPVVADGCVYVATSRGWVFAVNADTGNVVWKSRVPYGGLIYGSVGVAKRRLPAAACTTKRAKKKKRKRKSKRRKANKKKRSANRASAAKRKKSRTRRKKKKRRRAKCAKRKKKKTCKRKRGSKKKSKKKKCKARKKTRRKKSRAESKASAAKRKKARKKRKKATRCGKARRKKTRRKRRRAKSKASAAKRKKSGKKKRKKKAKCKKRKKAAKRKTAGTVYVVVSRNSQQEGCPKGDPCKGPYAVAFDQATGKRVWATRPIDTQNGSEVYGSPVFADRALLIGVSGGAAEIGDEADRFAFQGSMVFLDMDTGRKLRKTWVIHPPKKPDDLFAGAGIWSTPAIDTKSKVAYAGTGNPFKPQAEHRFTNAILKFDVDRGSPSYGRIIGSYKGTVDEYIPGFSKLPCYDFPGNEFPPFSYPQGVGSCGDIDMDFGASPNLFTVDGRQVVGEGQKSGVYHVADRKTMQGVWKQILGPPSQVGGIVGSTAYDGRGVYGPVTVPGYVWAVNPKTGAPRWFGPIADTLHYGPPVASANGAVYSVDLSGFLDVFEARSGALIAKRPLAVGGSGPESFTFGGVSVARNTIYAAVGTIGLGEGFVVAFRPGGASDVVDDVGDTGGGGGGGGGGGSTPGGAIIMAGPQASSTGYATPTMVTRVGGPLSFLNLDLVQHDVVAERLGPDGRPLFRSALVDFGESAPVNGLDRVQAGQTYGFFCSLHPGMRGNLVVR